MVFRTVNDLGSNWREGMEAATRGIALAQSVVSHWNKALLLAYAPSGGRWDEARIEVDTAHRLNPQETGTMVVCGHIMAHTGDPLEGIRLLERALRLNPRDPFAFSTYGELALAHLIASDYRKGLDWAMRSRSAAPGYALAHLYLAVLHVGLGEIGKAKAALEAMLPLAAALVQNELKGEVPFPAGVPRDRYVTFLRIAAGVEDPSAADALR